MNFSSLLSQEINKKRKQISEEKSAKKLKSDNEDLEASTRGKNARELDKHSDSLDQETKHDDQDSEGIEDGPKEPNNKESPRNSQLESHLEVSENQFHAEDQELLESITDEQLDHKLSEFNELENVSDFSKPDKIRRLQSLIKKQQKSERYKLQLENESKVDKDIKLEEIASPEFADRLYLQLRVYIKYLISEWESSVRDEDDELLLFETKKDLVKLLYKLRSRKLSNDMLITLSTIVYYLQLKDYLKANESYMKLSIGNVAWPIGVQNVGIHARSASSKITGEKNAANIMIDDKTRRWITGIKRLISFSERRWPYDA